MLAEGKKIYELYVCPTFVHNRIATADWKFEHDVLLYHNLIYVYDGLGTFEYDGIKKQVKAGDLVFFPKGCCRSMRTDASRLLKLYTVNFHAALPLKENAGWQIEPAEFSFAFIKSLDDEAVRQQFMVLFERLNFLFLTGENMQKVKLRETLSEILALADFCQNPKSISYSSRDKANKAVHYMTAHYGEKLTLKVLAESVGLSPSHFSAVFREATGRSPIDYLIHLRIFKAKQLLSDGCSVTEVARAVGFSDIYYFSNLFRKIEGVSPSRYRSIL